MTPYFARLRRWTIAIGFLKDTKENLRVLLIGNIYDHQPKLYLRSLRDTYVS
jgi:hypothetical protein